VFCRHLRRPLVVLASALVYLPFYTHPSFGVVPAGLQLGIEDFTQGTCNFASLFQQNVSMSGERLLLVRYGLEARHRGLHSSYNRKKLGSPLGLIAKVDNRHISISSFLLSLLHFSFQTQGIHSSVFHFPSTPRPTKSSGENTQTF